jgi:hypothetical protein
MAEIMRHLPSRNLTIAALTKVSGVLALRLLPFFVVREKSVDRILVFWDFGVPATKNF